MTREDFLHYAAGVYHGTRSVLRAVPADQLDHRPRPGMMSIGQLIRHLASATASPFKYVLENPGPAPGAGPQLPPVDFYKPYDTVQEALEHLDRDEKSLRETVMAMTEEEFQTRDVRPPWMPHAMKVWHFALDMVDHQSSHRMQLFQYLRCLGLPVNTFTLYGAG
ncbi:MAG: DinB family protein [Candidatus Sumerlaeia bacterium]|nr:DinB family protein [Candidatus Sumerlaeia bacterium]